MYGILLSAFNTVLAFVFKQVIVKFLVLFAVYFLIAAFVGELGQLVPKVNVLSNAFAAIPSSMWYFLDMMGFSQGFTMVVSAFVARFLIRRLPVIG